MKFFEKILLSSILIVAFGVLVWILLSRQSDGQNFSAESKTTFVYKGGTVMRVDYPISFPHDTKIVGVTKDCDCVSLPKLPLELKANVKQNFSLDVRVDENTDFPITRKVVLFTAPPSAKSVPLQFVIQDGRSRD